MLCRRHIECWSKCLTTFRHPSLQSKVNSMNSASSAGSTASENQVLRGQISRLEGIVEGLQMNGGVVSAGDGTTTRSAQAVESSQMVGSATENEDLRAKVHKLEETIAAMKAKKCGFCGQEGHDKPNCAAFKAQQQAQARATANAMPGRSGQPSTQRSNQKPLEKVCALPGCGKKFKTDKKQFTACCRDHQALLKEQREMIERADTVTVPTTTSIAAQFYRGDAGSDANYVGSRAKQYGHDDGAFWYGRFGTRPGGDWTAAVPWNPSSWASNDIS